MSLALIGLGPLNSLLIHLTKSTVGMHVYNFMSTKRSLVKPGRFDHQIKSISVGRVQEQPYLFKKKKKRKVRARVLTADKKNVFLFFLQRKNVFIDNAF